MQLASTILLGVKLKVMQLKGRKSELKSITTGAEIVFVQTKYSAGKN